MTTVRDIYNALFAFAPASMKMCIGIKPFKNQIHPFMMQLLFCQYK